MLHGYMLRFGGTLPDEAREQWVRESFRSLGPHAETLMAQWMSESPNSEALEELKSWVESANFRERGQEVHGPQGVERAMLLQPFFERRIESEEYVTPKEARQATKLFVDFHHHGAPFDGSQLLRIWGSCREGRQDSEWCQEWAHTEALKLDARSETQLLEECLGNRYIGERCREGLAEAQRLIESGDPGVPVP